MGLEPTTTRFQGQCSNLTSFMFLSVQVAPLTIHPAFEKAASYFNVKVVHVPLKSDLTPDMDAYKKV